MSDSSAKLRFWAFVILFFSSYSPLMLILAIKDMDLKNRLFFQSPEVSISMLVFAVISSFATLKMVNGMRSGLSVSVTKTSNKSGDMFGYTMPYMLSFTKMELADWRAISIIFIFLSAAFFMSYRSQSSFVNPVLAVFGYFLLDCSFKRGGREFSVMLISKHPVFSGDELVVEKISHYLYVSNSLPKRLYP